MTALTTTTTPTDNMHGQPPMTCHHLVEDSKRALEQSSEVQDDLPTYAVEKRTAHQPRRSKMATMKLILTGEVHQSHRNALDKFLDSHSEALDASQVQSSPSKRASSTFKSIFTREHDPRMALERAIDAQSAAMAQYQSKTERSGKTSSQTKAILAGKHNPRINLEAAIDAQSEAIATSRAASQAPSRSVSVVKSTLAGDYNPRLVIDRAIQSQSESLAASRVQSQFSSRTSSTVPSVFSADGDQARSSVSSDRTSISASEPKRSSLRSFLKGEYDPRFHSDRVLHAQSLAQVKV